MSINVPHHPTHSLLQQGEVGGRSCSYPPHLTQPHPAHPLSSKTEDVDFRYCPYPPYSHAPPPTLLYDSGRMVEILSLILPPQPHFLYKHERWVDTIRTPPAPLYYSESWGAPPTFPEPPTLSYNSGGWDNFPVADM